MSGSSDRVERIAFRFEGCSSTGFNPREVGLIDLKALEEFADSKQDCCTRRISCSLSRWL